MILYLTGIDGSGKTSLADTLEEHFNARHITALRIWARYSPKLAKGIVNIYKKHKLQSTGNYNTISPEEYTEWQKQKKSLSRIKLFRMAALLLFFIDYYIQILPVLKKIRKQHEKTIIVDRFVIDFLVDQTVNFGDLSDNYIYRKLLRECDVFDAVFFIAVDPETALKRKSDIPGLDYLTERDNVYRHVIKGLDHGYIIDNNGSLNSALAEIIKRINGL
jgi:thymidylate kinase